MALTVIARGKVFRAGIKSDDGEQLYCLDMDEGAWLLGYQASDYLGQTLVISLEEPSQGDSEEEELEPIINERLKMALA